jgi:hypothetical protein
MPAGATTAGIQPCGPDGHRFWVARRRFAGKPATANASYSRCLAPLLSTTFHRLLAAAPPLPVNKTGSFNAEAMPAADNPETNVSVASRQLSSAVVDGGWAVTSHQCCGGLLIAPGVCCQH